MLIGLVTIATSRKKVDVLIRDLVSMRGRHGGGTDGHIGEGLPTVALVSERMGAARAGRWLADGLEKENGWFLTSELWNASMTNAPLEKPSQLPFAHAQIGAPTGKLAATAVK
jgi:hypothetical protein